MKNNKVCNEREKQNQDQTFIGVTTNTFIKRTDFPAIEQMRKMGKIVWKPNNGNDSLYGLMIYIMTSQIR